jgi:hypothetical protein
MFAVAFGMAVALALVVYSTLALNPNLDPVVVARLSMGIFLAIVVFALVSSVAAMAVALYKRLISVGKELEICVLETKLTIDVGHLFVGLFTC